MTADKGVFYNMGFGSAYGGYILLGMMIAIIILVVLLIVLSVNMGKQKKRLDRLTQGMDDHNLEQYIIGLMEDNKMLKENAEKNRKDMRVLTKKVESAYQKMGLVKYDAFHQMGGQLSFSLCLLDDNDNGFIINSVHSTDGCYSYTKEIKAGKSDVDLGREEAEALTIALGY